MDEEKIRPIRAEAERFGHLISFGQRDRHRLVDPGLRGVCAPGITDALPKQEHACFTDGLHIRCRPGQRIPLRRFHSDDGTMWRANVLGERDHGLAFRRWQWWTPLRPGSGGALAGGAAADDRAGYALKHAWNDMRVFTRATMPASGHVFHGRAASVTG